MPNQNEIKTCPFCGKKPVFKKWSNKEFILGCSYINCHATAQVIKPTKELAIEAWNTRSNDNG